MIPSLKLPESDYSSIRPNTQHVATKYHQKLLSNDTLKQVVGEDFITPVLSEYTSFLGSPQQENLIKVVSHESPDPLT